jgi:hypothetical protein
MFQLAPVMISMHQCQLCGSCGAGKISLYLITKMNYKVLEQQINIKFYAKLGKNASDIYVMLSKAYKGETMKISCQVFLSGINGSKTVCILKSQIKIILSLSLTSRVLFTLNSFHKAKQSTKLIMWKY